MYKKIETLRKIIKKWHLIIYFLLFLTPAYSHKWHSKWPRITAEEVKNKIETCFQLHAIYKNFVPELIRRTIKSYYLFLDHDLKLLPPKEANRWLSPTNAETEESQLYMEMGNYEQFVELALKIKLIINEKQAISGSQLEPVYDIFREIEYTLNSGEWLIDMVHTLILKSFASSLDSHSQYLTPEEIDLFVTSLQQETVGIGVILKPDEQGAKITQLINKGPAHRSNQVHEGSIITKVDGLPILGMELKNIISLLKGTAGSQVTIEIAQQGRIKEVKLVRETVTSQDNKIETLKHPFENGVIAIIALHSFYENETSSCANDLENILIKMKEEHGEALKAILLDLRKNAGGFLKQGVDVTSLFIKSGVVVSIKDGSGEIHRLRHYGNKTMWMGPVFVLISRESASCAEIVSQSLKDYGRALILGDDRTYGKGSFQIFTQKGEIHKTVHTSGDVKLTRGIYYTVSGTTPQNTGVIPDLVLPNSSSPNVGEHLNLYSIPNEQIEPIYDDTLDDIPDDIKNEILPFYKENLQKMDRIFVPYLDMLRKNSEWRILRSGSYHCVIKDDISVEPSNVSTANEFDFQLAEAINVIKDFIYLGVRDSSENSPLHHD